MDRQHEDVVNDFAVEASAIKKLGHCSGGAAAKERARAEERLAALRAEFMAANWSPEAAAELAVIHVRLHPEGTP